MAASAFAAVFWTGTSPRTVDIALPELVGDGPALDLWDGGLGPPTSAALRLHVPAHGVRWFALSPS